MAEMSGKGPDRQLTVRHRGRIQQIRIYFRKFLRMFVYQSDWITLPMAALIAGLVGFTLGGAFGADMEGTMMGAFAVVCVCIWNGSFNSIQVICRERDVVKRDHRSGMHISSYIMAHMMYQLILCTLETAVSLFVLKQMGMTFPGKGLFTPWLVLEAGITLLLITYASDLLSLWISALVHSTTTAMTIMPFVLIFQLVFSGGLFSLPGIVDPILDLTISNPGLKVMASQSRVNDLPYKAVTTMLNLIEDMDVEASVTIGQVLDALSDTDNQTIAELRGIRIGNVMTVREVGEDLLKKDVFEELRSTVLTGDMTVGQVIAELMDMEELDDVLEKDVGVITTFGEAVDFLSADETVREYRDETFSITANVGDVLDLVGREETKALVEKRASEALYNPDYAYTKENIVAKWLHLLVFIVVFALLSIITLEFIDKDRR